MNFSMDLTVSLPTRRKDDEEEHINHSTGGLGFYRNGNRTNGERRISDSDGRPRRFGAARSNDAGTIIATEYWTDVCNGTA